MTLDLWMPYYMLMLVLMTFTLMQGHSGSAKANNQCCMLSATKQAITKYYIISIKLAKTVGHFLCDHDLDFANVYMACPSCIIFPPLIVKLLSLFID